MGITTLISAVLASNGWRWRRMLGGYEFAYLMLAVTIYAGMYTLELAATSFTARVLWGQLQYIGVVALAPLWLLFASRFSGHERWITRARVLALWALPVVHLVLVFTNDLHRLVWPTITQLPAEFGSRLVYSHGPAVWVFTAYSYLAYLTGALLLIFSSGRSSRPYRLKVGVVVVGTLIPILANALYLWGLNPLPGFDLTGVGFMVSGVVASVAITVYRNWQMLPVAQDVIFRSMGDGVLVLDDEDRLMDLNPTAQQFTGLAKDALGRNLFDLFPGNETVLSLKEPGISHAMLEIGTGADRQLLDATISPISNEHGSLQGRVVLLRDIRQERAMREAERRRTRQIEALNIITHAALRAPSLTQMLQVLANSLGVIFDADGAYLTLWDAENQRSVAAAAYGAMRDDYATIKPEPGEKTITESVLAAGKVLQVEDTANSPYLSPRIAANFPAESILALPLIADEKKLGAVLIAFHRSRRFTPADVALAEQVAAQVAVSIAKVQLFEAEREQRQLAEALRGMGMTISESLDLETVLDRLLEEIGKVVAYDGACVMLVDAQARRARIVRSRWHAGHANAAQETKTLPLESDIASTPLLMRMIESGQPVMIADTQAEMQMDGAWVMGNMRSWAGAPILARGAVTGFLSLYKSEVNFYQSSDASSLAAFTAQAAIAIENARNFTEMQRVTQRERLVFAAMRDFTAGLDSESVLRAVARHMIAGLKVDGCTVSRYDAASDSVITLFDINTDPAQHPLDQPGQVYPLGQYRVTREVIESGQPAALYLDDADLDAAERVLMDSFCNQSLLMLPLIVGRERSVLGLLELFRWHSTQRYTESDIELAQSLAAQAAVALENARLYAETQHLAIIDDLTGVYNRRGLFELGQREFERATRFRYPLSALFLDIDHFKLFNDRYSYAVGDQVLRMVAECVRANLRDFDLLGRYGGEEFAVLLPEASLEAAVEVAERARRAVQALRVSTALEETGITISIGVSTRGSETASLEDLLDRAGQAVHKAKAAGRNQVAVE